MKKLIIILYCFFFHVFSTPALADESIKEIQEELRKCNISIRTSVIKDIAECLKHGKNGSLGLGQKIKVGWAMIKCTEGKIQKNSRMH